jgi:hypothetical protein
VPTATGPVRAGACAAPARASFAPLAVSSGKRNCKLFQALFHASITDNDGQTYCTLFRWVTRALLLGFM